MSHQKPRPSGPMLLWIFALLFLAGAGSPRAIAQRSDRDVLLRFAEFAKRLDALPPTPMGKGHLGHIAPGRSVHLRFPVPRGPVAGYWLHLGNVVAYSGRGAEYQLILHRDAPDGPVVYTGPVIVDGDAWNAQNSRPIDLTSTVAATDRKRGLLDIFVSAKVRGDDWTVYRHNPGRPIFASAAVLTPELQARIAAENGLRRRGIALLPIPRKIAFGQGPAVRFPAETPILLADLAAPELRNAADELRTVVFEHTGVKLPEPKTAATAGTPTIVLRLAGKGETSSRELKEPEGYVLHVRADGAEVVGGGPAGVFYGAVTLAQLVRPTASGAGFQAPVCEIRDRPAFKWRIIQYDIARGQTVNVPYVKRLIRALARCKINTLLFYMEDDFKFRKYPFLGRPGTFTHAKARELSEYAHRFHMQLVPQFESLGHAAAVLRHPQMAPLRENGAAWDFCTMEEGTWRFLDDVYGELVEAFPYSEFIHVGGDEFETAFGKCPKCRQVVAKGGLGELYALHMNRLNQLVEKHGRTTLFWPSHNGPTPALSRMTLQYADKLDKNMIPTEWIYHGPAAYPTVAEYQAAGFKDVFCSPAVVDYSRVWPDYPTTFRGISGFFRWGAKRGCGGAYCTTWEFMHGALIENSMYGLLYAAECSWAPAGTSRDDFDRRFGAWWFGLGPKDATALAKLFYQPVKTADAKDRRADFWRGGRGATHLLWLAPDLVLTDWVLRTPQAVERAQVLADLMDAAVDQVKKTGPRARRHPLTLRAADLAFSMLRYAAHKPLRLNRAAESYSKLPKLDADNRTRISAALRQIAGAFSALSGEAEECARRYRYFVEHCGAYPGDADALDGQASALSKTATRLGALADKAAAGTLRALPSPGAMGLLTGRAVRIGEWSPKTVSEKGAVLRFPLPADLVRGVREIRVSWEYLRGGHGLAIRTCRLVRDGKTVADDRHAGWAGAGTHGNLYTLTPANPVAGGKLEIVGEVRSHGGNNSFGEVWVVIPKSTVR
ncbi:MAG: family 20 glycosylhydrolase [Kiritimatiellaeota bacterium]|nr:family 20 glycosylhydrolase [Kiritimatiellota bacterium]